MNIPGFTAEKATNESVGRFRSNADRPFGSVRTDNLVYLQKPNSENTPGGKCYGRVSGTTISGTYDSTGRCCTAPAPNTFPVCIDCHDVGSKCYDRAVRSRFLETFGNFGQGTFARF